MKSTVFVFSEKINKLCYIQNDESILFGKRQFDFILVLPNRSLISLSGSELISGIF